MALIDRIEQDFKVALKAKDAVKLSTLRMLKAALSNAAFSKKSGANLEDGEVVEVIAKQVKQHEESIAAFRKGNRADLAEKEEKEARILKVYLPPAMSEEELKALVQSTLQELKVSGPQAMGQVMKAVMAKVKGRADGKKVNEWVRKGLEG